MLFNSFIFFIFLGLVLPIFYLLKGKLYKNSFLLIVSYVFYGYWDWRFCLLLFTSTIVDFFIGMLLHKSEKQSTRKLLLLLSLSVNLGILGFFKYYNFFIDSFQVMSSEIFNIKLDYLHLNIILPVGISFYTFQTLSYTIDIYKKKLEPTSKLIDFALFVAFFPQLVAGPIERASNLLPQLSKQLSPSREQIKLGLNLIIIGLFKKVLLGDTTGRYVDHIFNTEGVFSGSDYFFALILFSIQIYADFSGYSSIARGTAKLLGVELMKNFEQPYLSRNITEFWRRWHISLSTWLRDYLYIPLGGNRKGTNRTYVNLMLTMLIGGLWHGASWNFVIWGGLHGVYLAVHKLIMRNKKPNNQNISFKTDSWYVIIWHLIRIIFTYLLVLITWLFFRSTDFVFTLHIFNEILNFTWFEHSFLLLRVTLVYFIVMITIDVWQYSSGKHSIITTFKDNWVQTIINIILLAIIFMYMLQLEPLPFIYFQF